MSRQHAMIIYEDERFFILDTGSSNGTFVNNIRLSKTGEESKMTEIFNGDIVRFGSDIVDKVNYLQCLQNCQERKRKKIVKFQCLYYNLTDEFSRENVELILIWFFPSNIEFPIFVLKSLVTWLKGLFWLVKVKNARDFFYVMSKASPTRKLILIGQNSILLSCLHFWKIQTEFQFLKKQKTRESTTATVQFTYWQLWFDRIFHNSWFQKFCE